MRVIDALHAPWAINPETLKVMLEVYDRHAAGDKIDVAAIEAAIGKPLNNDPQPYTVDQGVAILNCIGVMGKRFDLFTQICGGVSTQRLQDELQAAINDPTVHSIVLLIDSPGGTVDGTQALATDIFNARATKPIVALIDGQGASAAYWAASATSQVFITADTTVVGSIGVVMAHTDLSRAQEMRGVKVTDITAGKFKRIASQNAPLSADGRQSLQDIVDHIYSVFVGDVARNLGVSTDQVLKDMADGRLFLGEQAITAGLVHGMTTLSALIEKLNADRTAAQSGVGATAPNLAGKEETKMKFIICGAECETQEAVDAAVASAITKAKTEGATAGATAERERITKIQALAIPGHEKLIAEAITNGTAHADVAVAIVEAEKKTRTNAKDALIKDAPNGVPDAAAPGAEGEKKDEPPAQEIADKAKAHIAEQKAKGITVSAVDAVAHVRKGLGLK